MPMSGPNIGYSRLCVRSLPEADLRRHSLRPPLFCITKATNDFENFAPGGKHSTAFALVFVHRFHEFDFIQRVIPLACCRINESPPFNLSALTRSSFGQL